MTVLWKTKRAGFTMTGLELKNGSLFIGFSQRSAKFAAHKTVIRCWRCKEGSWNKTGISGSSNGWFFGIAIADAGKSMIPPSAHSERQVATYRNGESPLEAYRLARLSSSQS